MKKWFLLILSMVTAISCRTKADDAVAIYSLTNGDKGEVTVYKKFEKDGAIRYFVPKENIPDSVATLSINLDRARAVKGEDGFWILERGCLGYFNKDNGHFGASRNWLNLPYFGMKTPNGTFLAVMEGMRFEFKIVGTIKDGNYTIAPLWQIAECGFGAYETPSILVYELPLEADYNDMAKAYRKYKESRDPEIRPIKERMKERPQLEKLASSIALRQIAVQKPFDKAVDAIDFTAETEHQPYCVESFDKMLELLRRMKNELGMDDVAVCLAGWQTGGYDGRGPSIFPVCEQAGGESKLRELIKGGQELGYIVDAHTNFTDCFTVSPRWDGGNIACTNAEGKFDTNGAWHAGRAYNLCLKYAWDNYMQEDLRKVRDLGFYGCHYIDVFTASFPYRCCNPAHRANRSEVAQIQKSAAQLCRELFGGFSSECCMDHLLGYVDYINYAQRKEKDRRTALAAGRNLPNGADWDELVPFFELAFHDVVLSNPDKVTQEIPQGDDYLFLVEFGGRPIIYSFSEDNLPQIKEAYDRFQPLKHLMTEEMVSHRRLADSVACVTYGNGEKVIVNRSCRGFCYDGKIINSGEYIVSKPVMVKAVMSEIDHPSGKIMVLAHRGDWRNAPENSIRAYENALEKGAHIIEVDVRESKDSVLINMHDAVLDRTTTGKGKISEHTASEILALNLKDGHNYPTHHHPCAIEEVMETFKGRCVIQIDKADGHYGELYQLACKTGTVDQIIIKTYRKPFDLDETTKEVMKQVRFMPCISLASEGYDEIIDEYVRMGAVGFELTYPEETKKVRETLRRVREQNLCLVSTVLLDKWCGGKGDDRAVENGEEEECWGSIADLGPNIFLTDRLSELVAFFKKKHRLL